MPALDGLKVLEAGLLIQGPQAAALLHDWGAEVVKVELPGLGDQARWLPVEPGDGRSAFFIACNRGKRSLGLDLRVAAGREVFLRLAAGADVVISNFAPGTMERWSLGYDDLAAVNPRLVYAIGSTFGHRGPLSDREGADLAAQAYGGLVAGSGRDGSEPTPLAITITDHIAAQNLVAGILAALLVRERTGRGQRIETSLLGGQVWAQASELTGHLLTGRPHGRANRGHPLIPGMYAIFPTADGWLAIVGVAGALRDRFFELIGRPDLAERFPQPLYWDADKAELFPLVDAAMRARTTEEWEAALSAAGMRHAWVRNVAELATDEQVWANEYLATVDGTAVVATPVRFSDTPARAERDGARGRPAHRGGAARGRAHLGRDRRPARPGCDLKVSRYVVYGAGAIGGAIGARLFQAGHDVTLIARGAHLQAITEGGLVLADPDETVTLPIKAVGHPNEAEVGPGDIVVLAMKTHDTDAALIALEAVAPTETTIVCAQNGVENERLALRRFAHVVAMCVMMPAEHLEPGRVVAHSRGTTGMLDVGCYPSGVDATVERLAAELTAARFDSPRRPGDHAGEVRQAAHEPRQRPGGDLRSPRAWQRPVPAREGRGARLLRGRRHRRGVRRGGPGSARHDPRHPARRRERSSGGSSWQSLARGVGSIEVDHLNGEIVLLGRLHGVATPVNEALCRVANRMAREHRPPGSLTPDEVLA